MSPKWARLITRSTPQVIERPPAINAYRPPISAPLSTACSVLTSCLLVRRCPRRPHWQARAPVVPCGRSAGRSLDLGGRLVGRPDPHPLSILNLLDAARRCPEVVLCRIEGEVPAERGVRTVGVQPVADRLLIGALRPLHPVGQDLPGVPARR